MANQPSVHWLVARATSRDQSYLAAITLGAQHHASYGGVSADEREVVAGEEKALCQWEGGGGPGMRTKWSKN